MEIPLIAQLAAYAGIILTIVQYWMKTMIPLRVVGIATNILFLFYAGFAGILPTFLLNCIVLPLNLYRVHEMRQLIRRTQRAARADLDMTWLQPFMTRRRTKRVRSCSTRATSRKRCISWSAAAFCCRRSISR